MGGGPATSAGFVMAAAVARRSTRPGGIVGLIAVLAALCLGAGAAGAADGERDPVPVMPPGVIQLDETVISGNQELPKVLYIVPWQQPEGLPEIELRTDFGEVELFRRLYPPAYRRELTYYEAAAATDQTESNVSDSKE